MSTPQVNYPAVGKGKRKNGPPTKKKTAKWRERTTGYRTKRRESRSEAMSRLEAEAREG